MKPRLLLSSQYIWKGICFPLMKPTSIHMRSAGLVARGLLRSFIECCVLFTSLHSWQGGMVSLTVLAFMPSILPRVAWFR